MRILDDMTEKIYSIISPNIDTKIPLFNYTHLLNKDDWYKLGAFLNQYNIVDYESDHEKDGREVLTSVEGFLKHCPSYINPIRIIHEDTVCLVRTDVFLNQWWFLHTNQGWYNEIIKSIAHEMIHYLEYVLGEIYLGAKDDTIILDKYSRRFQEKYPKYEKRMKKALRKRQPDRFEKLLEEWKGKSEGKEQTVLPTFMTLEDFGQITDGRGTTI